MFFNVSFARRATAVLVLASILSAPVTSFGYDVPKQKHELAQEPLKDQPGLDDAEPLPEPPLPIIPLEERIPTLLPGNDIFPVEHCGTEYTICKFGKESWDYIREMQLRTDIAQKQLWVDVASSETPPNEEWIDSLLNELNELIEELQNLFDGRPIPEEGDPCLVKYRQCLLEEVKNGPKEEGRL